MKSIIIFISLFTFSFSNNIFSINQKINKSVTIISKDDNSLNVTFNINSNYKIIENKGFLESNLNVMNNIYKFNIDFLFNEEFNIEKVHGYGKDQKNKKHKITCKNNGVNLSALNLICSNGTKLIMNMENENPLTYNISNRDFKGKMKIYKNNNNNMINDIKIYLENDKYILIMR